MVLAQLQVFQLSLQTLAELSFPRQQLFIRCSIYSPLYLIKNKCKNRCNNFTPTLHSHLKYAGKEGFTNKQRSNSLASRIFFFGVLAVVSLRSYFLFFFQSSGVTTWYQFGRLPFASSINCWLQDDKNAHTEFVRLNRAYEVLMDEEMRKKYDQFGEKGLSDDFQGGNQYQSWQFYRDNFGMSESFSVPFLFFSWLRSLKLLTLYLLLRCNVNK